MPDFTEYLPQWTKKVVTEGGGRDPLGLSRLAGTLTDFLLTGIITLTHRARYYSFYTWALWHVEQQENSNDYSRFVRSLRRREAAMALSTLASSPALSPVGVEAARKQLDRGVQSGEYDCNFKVLPANELGGYGQYYAGSIYSLGITSRDEFGIHRVDSEHGIEVAEAFHKSIERTRYIKDRFFLRDTLPVSVLEELQKNFTLDTIRKDLAKKERAKLTEIYFGLPGTSLDEGTLLRRQTLTLILHLVSEYGKHASRPQAQNGRALDEYLLYALYYDHLWLENGKLKKYKSLPGHGVCHDFWKQFCLHQFVTQALEHLLFAVVEAAGDTGLHLDELVAELTQAEPYSTLRSATDADCSQPNDLLRVFGATDVPDMGFSSAAQKEIVPTHYFSEPKILEVPARTPQTAAAVAVALLAVLFAKWRGELNGHAMSFVSGKAGEQLWAGRVLRYVDSWLAPDAEWVHVLKEIISDLILDQHDRIMYEKRRLDSSWITRSQGRIVKDQDFGPAWRASRLINAVGIMVDLNLLENEQSSITITAEGQRMIEKYSS